MVSRTSWVFVLRGVLAILFGILAFLWPGPTILTLVLFFGSYVLVDGVAAVVADISSYGSNERWWAMLMVGLAGILIGLVTLFSPRTTAIILMYYIAAWAVLIGVVQIMAAIQMRRVIIGERALIVSGILSLIFGLLIVVFPGAGALSILWIVAVYAIIFGVMLIVVGFRIRGFSQESQMRRAART
jgi:uncharacterized membrane protein HdeD (DUF308 family)